MKFRFLPLLVALALPCFAADTPTVPTPTAAPTIKARALELREVTITATDPTGKTGQLLISYAALVRLVLLTPPPNGHNADDVVKAIEVWEPIKKVIDAHGKQVLLSDADYQFLLARLNAFPWGGTPDTQQAIADFITYVRGLQEQDYAATPAK
jgi:hypothetical protein